MKRQTHDTQDETPSRGSTLHRIEVWYVDVRASASALAAVERATPRLSDEERQWPEVGQEGVRRSTRVALRLLLERFLVAGDVCRFRQSPLAYESAGRPVLGRGLPALPFSISHAGDHALIAIANTPPVGVDIEVPRVLRMAPHRREAVIAAAKTFESDAPNRQLSADSETDVLRAWTRLEAVGKARGSGVGRVLAEHGVFARSAKTAELPPGPALAVYDLFETGGPQSGATWPAGLVGAVAICPAALAPAVAVLPTSSSALDVLPDAVEQRIPTKHS